MKKLLLAECLLIACLLIMSHGFGLAQSTIPLGTIERLGGERCANYKSVQHRAGRSLERSAAIVVSVAVVLAEASREGSVVQL
jgi:hypothetical protein